VSLESSIHAALTALVAGRCYPDVAPNGAGRPYIVFQQVGGTATNFIEGTMPSLRNARIQVSCWATTRVAAANLARSAEEAMVTNTTVRAFVIGAMVADYEAETLLYGTRQDFSLAY
jgi:hypothetical protein